MTSVFYNCVFYPQIKTSIDFWYKRELNFKSLIQPSKFFPIELTGTYIFLPLISKIEIESIYKLWE